MKIRVHYFALLREQRGLGDEELSSRAATAENLYRTLQAEHGFTLPLERLKVVVNEEFASWDHRLSDGDRVAFIPPVAGG